MPTKGRPPGGVSAGEIFGAARGAQRATPASYGRAPSGFRLPEATRLGPVTLQIADLERSLDYYGRVLGLRLLERDGPVARLGAPGGEPLVQLRERKGVRPRPGARTGLFHYAILLPDRPSLGRFARHLEQAGIGAGAADHLVSEALYLRDPDHLGIEIYADRPRTAWRRVGRELLMTTDPLDLTGLVAAAGDDPWQGVPAGAVMGHLHLHVGDLALAAGFYSEGLGFDRMVWGYPGALFLGAGGYHHHLGTNVWAGPGARRPGEDEAQLLEWTIELPDEASLNTAAESLQLAGHAIERGGLSGGGSFTTRDPWGTRARLRAGTPP